MSSVDTSIYGNLLAAPKSVADYASQYDAADLAKTQLAGAKLNLIGQQQTQADQQAVRSLYERPGFDPSTPQGMADLSAASPTTALATRKAILDNSQIQATTSNLQGKTAKDAVETQGLTFDQAVKRKNQHLQQLVTVNDVPSAISWINDAVGSGELPMPQAQQVIQGLQSGKQTLQDWKQKAMMGGLTSQQQLEATKPTYSWEKTGGAITPVQTNAYAGTVGPALGIKPIPMTVSPDAQLSANTSTANNRATIAKDYKVAGYDANGNMVDPGLSPAAASGASTTSGVSNPAAVNGASAKSPLQGLVDAIGTYQSPESVALSRVPAAQKSQILAAVRGQYPDYDPGIYSSRQATNRDFSSAGKSGVAVKSFNVALAHLDTLQSLAAKLDNGQIPILNAAGNYIAKQTGDDAATNLESAKSIVMNEVLKATSGVAGAEGDRDRAQAIITSADSPKKLAGAISTVKALMGGQLAGLQRSYQAGTGRSDFSSKYLGPEAQTALKALDQGATTGSATPAATSLFKITHVNGQPQ